MFTVGLTGGVACGKSTVAKILASRGVPVIDADQVSREIVAPGEPALAEIAAHFGAQVLLRDGRLDRKALGALVMGADTQAVQARAALNAITHPRIFARIDERLQELAAAEHFAAVVEAAIMVESGNWRMYDALLVVACSPAVQLERLMARQGFDAPTAQRWISSQMPAAEKVALATAAVNNDGPVEALEDAVTAAWAQIVEHLRARQRSRQG